MLKLRPQELDAKTLSRLEKAVSKSQFSQGKKLKVVAKVRFLMDENFLFCVCLLILLIRSTPTSLVDSSLRLATAPLTLAFLPRSPR